MNPFLEVIAALDDSPAVPQVVSIESNALERHKPLPMAAIYSGIAVAIALIAVLTWVLTRSGSSAAPPGREHPALADANTPAPDPVDAAKPTKPTKPNTTPAATSNKGADTPAPAPVPWNLPIKPSPQIKVKSQEILSLPSGHGSVNRVMLDLATPQRVVVSLSGRSLDENNKPIHSVNYWLVVIDPSATEPPQYGRLEQLAHFNDAHQGKVVISYYKEHVFRIAKVQDQVIKTLHEVSPRVGDEKLPDDLFLTTGVTAKLTNSGNLVYGSVEIPSLPRTRRIVCINPQTQETVWSFEGEQLGQLAMSPTRDWVIVTNDQDLLFLNPDTGRIEARIPSIRSSLPFGYPAVLLSFSPDGRRLAVIHRGDKKIFVYDMTTGTRLHAFAFEVDVQMACFTEDSNYLLADLRGFDVNTGRQVWRYHTQAVQGVRVETFSQSRYWYMHSWEKREGSRPGTKYGVALIAAEVINPDIAAQIEHLLTTTKPLVGPGMRIALEIIMPGDAARVEYMKKEVTRVLVQENKLIVDPAASLKLRIRGSITPGKSQTVQYFNPRDKTSPPRLITVQRQECEYSASILDAQSKILWEHKDRIDVGAPFRLSNDNPQQAVNNGAANWLHFEPLSHLPPPMIYPAPSAGSGQSRFTASGLETP